MDIEIYIRNIDVDAAVSWLETKLGKLTLVDDAVELGIQIFHTAEGVAVTVTPGIEDGPFLSLFLVGEELPWTGSGQLATACAQELGKTVRWCDETTNSWREKIGDGPEHPIDWDKEDEHDGE